jgi:hypothetical protein
MVVLNAQMSCTVRHRDFDTLKTLAGSKMLPVVS